MHRRSLLATAASVVLAFFARQSSQVSVYKKVMSAEGTVSWVRSGLTYPPVTLAAGCRGHVGFTLSGESYIVAA